jgi:predicted nucleic acid-binding protein
MALLFWDASALAKRYTVEAGHSTASALFDNSPPHLMASTPWGYVETYSILLRRLNAGVLDLPSFGAAVSSLQSDLLSGSTFGLLPISENLILTCIRILRKHNLNATDASILNTLLVYL